MDKSTYFGYDPIIPDDVRKILMWLCLEVLYIQRFWKFYTTLFTHKDYGEVPDLLPTSFSIIEETLRNDIEISICRIIDPVNTRNVEPTHNAAERILL